MDPAPPSTLIVIPTYDEREALPGTLARLRAAVPEVDVLVVDDSSPDGTGEWAEGVAAQDPAVHVLHRAGKEGLGPAYLAGFAWGLERGYAQLGEMDADASHRPEQLPRLLEAMAGGADLAIGSRWVPGGRVHDWPLRRLLLSRGANLYVRALLGLGVADATAGYRLFRAELLARVIAQDVASQGYCFQVDMTRRARALGAVIAEVPIDFDERAEGASKMSSAIVREALVKVTSWGLSRPVQGLRKALR
ncbi:polyprenol monophosphomannose synthase [Brachybacterium saurashtrense]|uniref:Polyprenol monophosphomannose synthase n=1 Tax=Brachybacterium saurashtrense TaxID=556288 RepID=A0A345YMH1_9MICO|nr:polyprenol monophosphomannose synthase [Brachybacterium saurashtrense]AXK45123.1 polyprenol monophosphomannose synthase [Brachybacterium saurashtrense]RRR22124.1 polyprenol monophosphomannose synthase [Brachybacterium saurashtrense]